MSELIFDRFVLNLDQRLLLCDGDVVDLQPLVFDLLVLMARRPNKVVSKAELLPAVWRSSSVTESVVARAVMKARRALRDDAQAPTLLRTVPRVGYMLAADVEERATPAAARHAVRLSSMAPDNRMVLLPCENLTGQAALAWVDQGLMRLLHQWLEGTGTVSLAPMAEVQGFCRRLSAQDDAMAKACSNLGAAEAVRSQLWWSDDAFTLRCWRGNAAPGRLFFEATAADLLDLTRRLADTLAGPTRLSVLAGADAFWQEQVAQVVHMEQSGQPAQALALLDRSLPHMAWCLQLDLLKARLLTTCGRFPEALVQVDALLARGESSLSRTARVELLDRRGQCLHQCHRLDEAMDSFQQALTLSSDWPEAHPLRPDILGRAANTAIRQLMPSVAIGLAELAVEEAERLGRVDLQTRAALGLCGVLSLLDLRHRSATAVAKAIELGQRSGELEHEARAWRHQAALHNSLHRDDEAYACIKRSVALWLRCGVAHELFWVQVLELIICLEAGRFDEAEQLAAALAAQPELPATQRDTLAFLVAALDWRIGRDAIAIEQMRALVSEPISAVDVTRMVAHSELTMMYVHVGHLEEAQASLQTILGLPVMDKLERREAALALARGARDRAIGLLRAAWRSSKRFGSEGIWIAVDLSWLLLEDAPVRFESPELESLIAHVLDHSQNRVALQVLKAAYVLRQQPDEHSRAAWDEVVAQAAVLQRRCPVMLTPAYREAMAARTPPPLRELLSRVCW